MSVLSGLTDAEVRTRQAQGESNAASFRSSRTAWDIVRANLFNFFNNTLYAIGIGLIALGQYYDALTSVGLAVVNALIGTFQELRAKRQLDKISLLSRSPVSVIRDGVEQAIDPAALSPAGRRPVPTGDRRCWR